MTICDEKEVDFLYDSFRFLQKCKFPNFILQRYFTYTFNRLSFVKRIDKKYDAFLHIAKLK